MKSTNRWACHLPNRRRRVPVETTMPRSRLVTLTLMLAVATLVPHARLDAGGPSQATSESNGTPAAKARLAQGEAAMKAGSYAQAVTAFRQALELDRDFVEAHKRFIEASQSAGRDDPDATGRRLHQLYEGWAKRYPRKAVYRWALGFLATEPAKAEPHFQDAIRIDPGFARAHLSLARHADLAGQWERQRQHLRTAVESNPSDPQYLLRYAHAHKASDPDRFRELAFRVVDEFPASQAAAEALYQLADGSSGQSRRTYLDRVRAEYPADQFRYSPLAMDVLYGDVTDPKEALSIAQDMVRWLPTSKTWARRVAYNQALVEARQLLGEQKFADALALLARLEKTEPSSINRSTFVLMKAEAAAGSGQAEKAYEGLVTRVAAEPDDRLQAALAKQGSALNKTPQQIDDDVWRIRDAGATPAADFELTAYADGKPVKLSDYRGRIVLLSFWFPG